MHIDEQTLRDALAKWGTERQLRKLQEECCELAAAINRMADNRTGAVAEFIDELADVSITTAQMQLEFGHVVQVAIDRKMARLRERIAGGDS